MSKEALRKKIDGGTQLRTKDGLFIEGKLEGEIIRMVIDTGSNISIVTPQVLRDIGLDLARQQLVEIGNRRKNVHVGKNCSKTYDF